MRQANEETMVVAMIEDAEGVADLSQSYGVPWQTRHPPRGLAALNSVHGACVEACVPFCAIPRTPQDYTAWSARGTRAFVLGEERSLASRALRADLDTPEPDNAAFWHPHRSGARSRHTRRTALLLRLRPGAWPPTHAALSRPYPSGAGCSTT